MKKMKWNSLLLWSLLFWGTAACSDGDDPIPLVESSFAANDQPEIDNTVPTLSIVWNTTATKLSHTAYSAEYGRMHRVKGDTLLFTYHYGPQGHEWDNIAIKRSIDNGQTWSTAETLMADNNPNYYGFSNPEIIVLKNGEVLLAYTGRGNPDTNANSNIQVRKSTDRGWTFGPPKIVATGRSWEPAMIQLPDGVIQLFYSSEAKWWAGPGATAAEQEILMASSADNGNTWKSPKTVAYTAGMRDGMAVPLILQNNKGMVFPIESVNNSKSPWIVWSSMAAKWNYSGPGTTSNGRRWLATQENVWGGAPYIIQLPTGETLLSCQDRGGRAIGSDWKKNTMLVMVGNSIARNFTNITYPWPNLPTNEGAYYSSLFLKNATTVSLVTTRNYSDGHSEVFVKDGQIVR